MGGVWFTVVACLEVGCWFWCLDCGFFRFCCCDLFYLLVMCLLRVLFGFGSWFASMMTAGDIGVLYTLCDADVYV